MSIKEKLQQYIETLEAAVPDDVEPTMESPTLQSSENLRMARTHRLIQVGAIADQYLETVGYSPQDVELLLQELVQLPEVKYIISKNR